MNNVKQRENWVDLLKFLACLMITNSHCRTIYPYSFLAIGGGFGNALFFAISGYLLVNVRHPFTGWYARRCGRIIPITMVFVVINEMLCGGTHLVGNEAGDFFRFYLNEYWFSFAIIVYYCIYYFIFQNSSEKVVYYSFFAWLIVYVVLYATVLDVSKFSVELGGFSLFKVYFYFGAMLVGGLLRKKKGAIQIFLNKNPWIKSVLVGGMLLSFVGWISEYMAITVFDTAYQLQFLIHFFVLIFTTTIVILAWCYEVKPRCIIANIANSTLEIYLVQITYFSFHVKVGFPYNWLLFWGVAILGGLGVHSCVDGLKRRK